jgi:hypothetical protein
MADLTMIRAFPNRYNVKSATAATQRRRSNAEKKTLCVAVNFCGL